MGKLEKINKWIGTMSYYNAAEGSWTSEGTARSNFKDKIAEEVKKWDITEEEFLKLYNSCGRQLTSSSDFAYPLRIRKAFRDSK